jgi:hypothetical protein
VNKLKLLLPLALGLTAGGLHYWSLTRQPKTDEFVRLRTDVEEGTRIGEENLESVTLPVGLTTSLLPYADRSLVIGQPARTFLTAGDLLTWANAKPPAARPQVGAGERAVSVPMDELDLLGIQLRVGDHISFVVSDPARQDLPRYGPFRVAWVGRDGGRRTVMLVMSVKPNEVVVTDAEMDKLIRTRADERTGRKIVGVVFEGAASATELNKE